MSAARLGPRCSGYRHRRGQAQLGKNLLHGFAAAIACSLPADEAFAENEKVTMAITDTDIAASLQIQGNVDQVIRRS